MHYSITKNNLFDLFSRLAEKNSVLVPYDIKDRFVFAEFDPDRLSAVQLSGIRQTQPLKSFINPVREKLSGDVPRAGRPVIIAGVKACDLASLILQDFIFLKGDYEDPFYKFHRNNTLIISCDCTQPKETCFCNAMEGAPYPTRSFDLNLSPLDGYFLVEAASDKGKALIDDYKTFFKKAEEDELLKRDAARAEASGKVKDYVMKRSTPEASAIKGVMKKQYDNLGMWQDFSSTCIECGACNLVCPTCHCFLIFDERSGGDTARGRTWDACLYKTFAKVAGGANPRKHLYERLRNRFDKKFAFFPEILDYTACTGCGRCIEACPGDIDIREVLKGLVLGSWRKPPHE